jgi:hypothetical protein
VNIFSDLQVDPSTWHPTWCSPLDCTAPDRLAERGLVEADVPLHKHHAHYSTPVTIGSAEREDAVLTLQAERFVDQPPASPGVDAVELTVEHRVHGTRVVALLEPDLLDQLAVAVADLQTTVLGAAPTLVDRAIRELRAFGGAELHNDDVPAALECWRHSGDLSDEDFAAVVAAFPDRPAQHADGDR